MSWAAVRVSSIDSAASSQVWGQTRSCPGLPRLHAPAVAPVQLLQVLVVVICDWSNACELRPDAPGVGLVSRPGLGVDVRPVVDWVPDPGYGTDEPKITSGGRDIVVPKLIGRHAKSILPDRRPEYSTVGGDRG